MLWSLWGIARQPRGLASVCSIRSAEPLRQLHELISGSACPGVVPNDTAVDFTLQQRRTLSLKATGALSVLHASAAAYHSHSLASQNGTNGAALVGDGDRSGRLSNGDGAGDISSGTGGHPQHQGYLSSSVNSDDRSVARDRPDDLIAIRDLPSLARLVEQRVADWSQTRDIPMLKAAFRALAEISPDSGMDPVCRRTFDMLSAAYLPLMYDTTDINDRIIPLWAGAVLNYWHGVFPEALLLELGAGPSPEDGARVAEENMADADEEEGDYRTRANHRRTRAFGKEPAARWDRIQAIRHASEESHLMLSYALLHTPLELAKAADRLLSASIARLVGLAPDQLDARSCADLLVLCARLKRRDGFVLHHLTACLVAKREAHQEVLVSALCALGELAKETGYAPRHADLQRLAEALAEKLQEQERQRLQQQQQDQEGEGPTAGLDGSDSSSNSGSALWAFSPQDVSKMLTACCRLKAIAGALRSMLLPLAIVAGHMSWQMDPHSLAESLYALAKLDCTDDAYSPSVRQLSFAALLAALVVPEGRTGVEAADAADSLDPVAVALAQLSEAQLCWEQGPGMEKTSASGPADAAAVAAALLEVFVREANARDCSIFLWALAVVGVHEQRLVDALVRRLGQQLRGEEEGLVVQDLTTGLWALAVMGPGALLRLSDVVQGLLREAVRRWEATGGRDYPDVALRQLWQVQQELVALGGDRGLDRILSAGEDTPQGSPLGAARRVIEHQLQSFAYSELYQDVLNSLQTLQQRLRSGQTDNGNSTAAAGGPIVAILLKHHVEGLCSPIPALVELACGRRVALIVESPSRSLANEPHTRMRDGTTVLRDRLLQRVFAAGEVVSVPYWEWAALHDEDEKHTYLRRVLRLSGVKCG